MKTYRIPRTDLVVSRVAYGCLALFDIKVHLNSLDLTWPLRSQDKKRAAAALQALTANGSEIAKAERLIHAACDNGINFFDHADIYGAGKCEEVFGAALQRMPGLREKIVIQTKCAIRIADDPPGNPIRFDYKDSSYEHIVRSAESALRRLQTDRLDILLLHMPDALVEPEEVARAFDELHRSGKVRYFGVSNHTVFQIERLKKYVRQPLVVNQIHLGLAHPYAITDGMDANRTNSARITCGFTGSSGILDYCLLNDIQVQAFSPLRSTHENPPDLLDPSADAAPEIQHAARVVAEVARKKDVAPSAILLAWLLRHPGGIVPVIGTSDPKRIAENCAADRVELSREEWYALLAAVTGLPSLGHSRPT